MTLGGNFPSTYDTTKFPQLNVIGVEAFSTKKTPYHEWTERWPGALTSPVNLYEAQLQRRHGQGNMPQPPAPEADTDGDGLSDTMESTVYGTNPTKADTDGDGLSDGAEIKTHNTNPLKADTDSDGVTDAAEVKAGTDPTKAPSTPPATGTVKLWLEAEAGTSLTQPLVIGTDAAASGGKYVWVPNGQGNLWDATGTGGRSGVSVFRPSGGHLCPLGPRHGQQRRGRLLLRPTRHGRLWPLVHPA